jgi:hypothetical protein
MYNNKNYLLCKDGNTLMHLASAAGHPGTAMVFMKKGVALHMPNKVINNFKIKHTTDTSFYSTHKSYGFY